MDWLNYLSQIFNVLIVPILGAVAMYIVKYINTKSEEIKTNTNSEITKKYVDLLAQTISDCVVATNQTYVNVLKDKNAFDASAQKEAFNLTYKAVMNILNEDAKEYLQLAYGDLNTYITKKIEAEVNLNKTMECAIKSE